MAFFLLFLLWLGFLLQSSADVLKMRMEDFPKSSDKIALHFSCQESEVFATNCACHLRCTDSECSNAVRVCKKYEKGGSKKIATLKRIPTSDEMTRLSVDEFRHAKTPLPTRSSTMSDLIRSCGALGHLTASNLHVNDQSNLGKHCAKNSTGKFSMKSFQSSGIGLVALSYRSPLTLANSMRTWNSSGLLNMMKSRIALLNDPLPIEVAMSQHFAFQVIQPRDIPNANVAKPNVLTIGGAFYYALQQMQTEYILFLENDFKMDTSLSPEVIMAELIAAAGMLERGAQIVRLLSRKGKGCGTFKDCDHGGIHLKSSVPTERLRNWYSFYCRGHPGTEKLVSDCFGHTGGAAAAAATPAATDKDVPSYRCFTSWDSNWSLNAVMVKRADIISNKYSTPSGPKSIADISISHAQQQDGFESDMAYGVKWMRWKVPICISYNGLFLHEEIETSA